MTDSISLRAQILELVRAYAEAFPASEFMPGRTTVPPSGKVIGAPEMVNMVDAAWFGYPITLKSTWTGMRRVDLLRHLDRQKIGVRLLFSGNVTHQPYLQGREYRVSGTLENADRIMNDTFWIGLYPGLKEAMLEYSARVLHEYQHEHERAAIASPSRTNVGAIPNA